MPFRTHDTVEFLSGPVRGPAVVTGALEDPRARNYFLALGAVLVMVYNLANWDAIPDE